VALNQQSISVHCICWTEICRR